MGYGSVDCIHSRHYQCNRAQTVFLFTLQGREHVYTLTLCKIVWKRHHRQSWRRDLLINKYLNKAVSLVRHFGKFRQIWRFMYVHFTIPTLIRPRRSMILKRCPTCREVFLAKMTIMGDSKMLKKSVSGCMALHGKWSKKL
jgi:hypothetical protein